jgi:Holliday junction resolvase RusA-like endonuclease
MANRVIATIIIPGRPVVLKNSKQIINVHGRRIIKSNPRVEAYQHRAIAEIVKQWGDRKAITDPVGLRIISYLAARHDSGNLPDASNLYQCPEDLLQSAGVIEDDRLVEHHDGSRRICMCDGPCPLKPIYKAGPKKGQPKDNCGAVKKCPFERVEIEISPAVPDVIENEDEYRCLARPGRQGGDRPRSP